MKNYKRSNRNKLFRTWHNMVERCNNPKRKDFVYYGGRGIKIDERWFDFKNFVDEMHDSFKEGCTLDRVDNNKVYSKLNCRWVDLKTQCNNRRSCNYITNPKTKEIKTITEWARIYKISRNTITSRIRLGYKDFFVLVSKILSLLFSE